jgi:glutamate-1-semialdehyde 2,1-aminomutase
VNSPVRAYGSVGGTPRFIQRGEGAYVIDADGERLLDYVQSWGASLFGHAREEIVRAATDAVTRGTSFGAPTEPEVELAERISRAMPSMEMVRLVSSGTEAAMSAIRLARGYTERSGLVKFAGGYHGHSDALLVQAGSGVASVSTPSSAGVTEGAVADTMVLPYNHLAGVDEIFMEYGETIAAVIVEPVAANMGVVPPVDGFLEGLRALCTEAGALLVFDEVITGFRVAFGGAQSLTGVTPDLTVLGKVMGGGFPCAAFGGRRDVMEMLAPVGPVYQAGTLSGNPVAVSAGIAALELAERESPYGDLEKSAELLSGGIGDALQRSGIPHTINREASLFSLFFAEGAVHDFETARAADHDRYGRFFHDVLEAGILLPPSGYEAWFLSTAHGERAIDATLEAAARFSP